MSRILFWPSSMVFSEKGSPGSISSSRLITLVLVLKLPL